MRLDEEILISVSGAIRAEEFDQALEALQAAGLGDPTTYLLVDFTQPIELDLTVEEIHGLHLKVRRMFELDPGHRTGVAAPSATLASAAQQLIDVRDLLTARDPASLSEVGIFETVEEARAWAAAPD